MVHFTETAVCVVIGALLLPTLAVQPLDRGSLIVSERQTDALSFDRLLENAVRERKLSEAVTKPSLSAPKDAFEEMGFAPSDKFLASAFKRLYHRNKNDVFGNGRTEGSAEQAREGVSPLFPRVVVTGMGVVNGVGIGVEEFWENLLEGVNPCDIVKGLPESYACRVGCPVSKEFNATKYYNNKVDVKRTDRYAHFAMAASKLAIEDGNLDLKSVHQPRFGTYIGSGIGGFSTIEKEMAVYFKNPNRVSPLVIPAIILNVSPGQVAAEVGARGPSYAPVSACATGTHAIGEAFKAIRHGDVDVMLAGGSEATLTGFAITGFSQLQAVARNWNHDPKRASRPFDAKRSGFVMGEGAGVLLLESEAHALARGARIYGELVGYGSSCDAYHITAPRPDGSGLVQAVESALAQSGLNRTDIGYINAHGTSTPLNDKTETLAIKKIFGADAENLLISSTKSMTGHCLGAAGGIEAVATVKALETGIAPPTINYEHPDPACDLFYCPNKKVVSPNGFKAVMSNSLGFGGQNAVLVFKKYRP